MQLPRRPLIRCTMFGAPLTTREPTAVGSVASLRALAGLLVRGHLTEREFTAFAGRVLARTEGERP